ncbi:hypothetical protein TanjilG_11166 [Lupinus angustifolius]|uniref:Uncharacterized protein n=1 Tax=Lupinus angustifolius TaxID=3871 RepID=A0A394DFY0_LUPAN|nr:hypothetical protein TanjilG_11166 [Lupinus angustifolius]
MVKKRVLFFMEPPPSLIDGEGYFWSDIEATPATQVTEEVVPSRKVTMQCRLHAHGGDVVVGDPSVNSREAFREDVLGIRVPLFCSASDRDDRFFLLLCRLGEFPVKPWETSPGLETTSSNTESVSAVWKALLDDIEKSLPLSW